jgi:folate-dependent phosphoribosylglycinamide formyltransferase PurN
MYAQGPAQRNLGNLMSGRLVLLGGDKPSTWIVYNDLVARFGLFPAIIEQPVPRLALVRNRMRKLGISKAASQVAFALLIRPVLNWRAHARTNYLLRHHGLEAIPPQSDQIHRVASVNDLACHELLQALDPDVVVVSGTRILSKTTLGKLKESVINVHHGITPQYRGAHGAYWSLMCNDRAQCGVTVHLVDEGIDTGNVISKALISPDSHDSFVTYPLLQTAGALDLIADAVAAAGAKKLETRPVSGPSAVWYHPGFFEYLGGALRGIK